MRGPVPADRKLSADATSPGQERDPINPGGERASPRNSPTFRNRVCDVPHDLFRVFPCSSGT
jgi:hypothetical protein